MLGPLEQAVMNCVWNSKKATVREVHSCLKNEKKIAYTTVMTIMSRLAEKKYLSRELVGNTHVYSAGVSKANTLKKTLARMADYILNNFGEEAIVSFVEELDKKGLSEQKRKELISKLAE